MFGKSFVLVAEMYSVQVQQHLQENFMKVLITW